MDTNKKRIVKAEIIASEIETLIRLKNKALREGNFELLAELKAQIKEARNQS